MTFCKEQLRRTCSKKSFACKICMEPLLAWLLVYFSVNLVFNFNLYFITSLTLPNSGLLLNRYFKSNLYCILVYLSVLDNFWPVWALSRRHKKQDDFSDFTLIRIVLSRTKTSAVASSIFCYDDGLSFISVKYSDKWWPLK